MPPNIEAALYSRGVPAWHNLGVVIPDQATVDDVFHYVPELAAQVEQRPIFAQSGGPAGLRCDGWFANVRTRFDREGDRVLDDEAVVGIVKGRYTLYQTDEQFELIRELVDQHQLDVESAGTLKGGAVTWLLVKLPEALRLLGDHMETYVLLVNSFDASYSLTWAMTNIRVECQNLLNLALRRARRVIRIRHTRSMEDRIAQVREALGLTFVYRDAVVPVAEGLARTKLTATSWERFMNELVPLPPLKVSADTGFPEPSRARDNALELREHILAIRQAAPDLAEHRDNAWGALQAVSAYVSHAAPSKSAEARFERLAISDSPTLVTRAQGILSAMAGLN